MPNLMSKIPITLNAAGETVCIAHHYHCETPNGQEVICTCSLCGMVQRSRTSWPDEYNPPVQLPGGNLNCVTFEERTKVTHSYRGSRSRIDTHKKLEESKTKILADLEVMGLPKMLTEHGIKPGSWNAIRRRWGLKAPERVRH